MARQKRNKANTTSIIRVDQLSSNIESEAGKFVTRAQVQEIPCWGKMKAGEQNNLVREVQDAAASLMVHGLSGLRLGEHLYNTQQLLQGHRGAYKWVIEKFNFSAKTAQRLVDGYAHSKNGLPPGIHKALMIRGVRAYGPENRPFGVYTSIIKQMPPPINSDDPGVANHYVDQVLETYSKNRSKIARENQPVVDREGVVDQSPRTLLRDAYRGARNPLTHIPAKKKREFLDTLVGMLLTEIGIGHKTAFSPEAIPEDMKQGRGRPRLVA